MGNISIMVSTSDGATRKPYTELLKSSGSQAFPNQLMKILSIKEYEDIISWLPDGKSFFIHDKKKLNDVLSCYFQSTKYDSFRRKLHRWGFRIAKKGTSSGAYAHKLFVRDNPSLCSEMRCAKQGSSAITSRRSSNQYSASNNDVTIEQNLEMNQQPYSLKTCNDIEKYKSFFQNYVMTMHTNYWRKRPLLLEGSFYLQRHMQSMSQSSKELVAINGLLTINSERKTFTPGTINNKLEFVEEIRIRKEENSDTVSSIRNKLIEGSPNPFLVPDQITSTNAIAA